MMRHDENLLWQYAARELDAEDARLVQHHLSECPDCQEHLADVRTAQGALTAARAVPLWLDYASVDQAISREVSARLERSAFGSHFSYALALTLVVGGLTLAAYGVYRHLTPTAEPMLAAQSSTSTGPALSSVERAVGLVRVGAEQQVLSQGMAVTGGDVLKTAPKGEAVVRLSDGSRLALETDSQLSLTRVAPDEVALTLERGLVMVAASHSPRKGFVVHSAGLVVRVVGTTFSVASVPGGIEVSVAQGRVAVEPPESLPVFVSEGQRARFDTQRWRMKREALPAAAKAQLLSVTAVEPTAAPALSVAPATGGPSPVAPEASDEETLPALPAHGDEVDSRPVMPAPPVGATVEPSRASVGDAHEATGARATSVQAGPPRAPRSAHAPAQQRQQGPLPRRASAPIGGSSLADLAAAAATDLPAAGGMPTEPFLSAAASPAAAVQEAPLQVPLLSSPLPARAEQAPASDWAPMPAPSPEPQRGAARLDDDSIPDDAEMIFLQRAERSLTRGSCARYLLGLEELAIDPRRVERAERARITRARCLDASMKPLEATVEYRKYLQQYPQGRFADEARLIVAGE